MSFSFLEACRKRKRRAKTYGFHIFGEPGCPITLIGPFRDNIRVLLQECGELEDYNVQGMLVWVFLLVHEKMSPLVPLYIIEENVQNSSHPFCDHCRCAGWGGHYVSKRRYHVIIPLDSEWNRPLSDDVFDLQSHLLHGLFHCNGCGHLLCINGMEGSSKYLCGREIMDLWDRICTSLRTRKVAVEDLSKKRSMDLRLLHGVAYGHSWFGRWGYRFFRGSFGVKEHSYNKAIEILSSLELDKILQDFVETDSYCQIRQIIRHYRDMSETQLVTIKDLLKFMLIVKYRSSAIKKSTSAAAAAAPPLLCNFTFRNPTKHPLLCKPLVMKEKSVRYRKFTNLISHMDSRWPARRLEYAAEVIVEALKEKKSDKFSHCGMTRQDVRDAARLHIGDTGLLDYVLKSLNNVIVGRHVVRRTVNPTTRILEYTIQELSGAKVTEIEPEIKPESPCPVLSVQVPGIDVYGDVAFVYKNVFFCYPDSDGVDLEVQTVLDSKHFMKEWPLRDEAEQLLTFTCLLKPDFGEVISEVVVVPLHSTVGDLKRAAEAALRDTYCVTDHFVVTDVEGLEEVRDGEVLFGVFESGVEVLVRGMGIDKNTQLRYEGGSGNWKVKCDCGAQDDDGERMVECDICEVWQHTRCCGIEDSETVPPLFVCLGCCDSLVPPKTEVESAFSVGGDCADAYLLFSEAGYPMEVGY